MGRLEYPLYIDTDSSMEFEFRLSSPSPSLSPPSQPEQRIIRFKRTPKRGRWTTLLTRPRTPETPETPETPQTSSDEQEPEEATTNQPLLAILDTLIKTLSDFKKELNQSSA